MISVGSIQQIPNHRTTMSYTPPLWMLLVINKLLHDLAWYETLSPKQLMTKTVNTWQPTISQLGSSVFFGWFQCHNLRMVLCQFSPLLQLSDGTQAQKLHKKLDINPSRDTFHHIWPVLNRHQKWLICSSENYEKWSSIVHECSPRYLGSAPPPPPEWQYPRFSLGIPKPKNVSNVILVDSPRNPHPPRVKPTIRSLPSLHRILGLLLPDPNQAGLGPKEGVEKLKEPENHPMFGKGETIPWRIKLR